ncbi:carbohydrate-binding domain protein [Ceratobasidium sp. AG-Ba]|nr:carbohydrate-binding domain protein [Ceratobasidium sp. AG-Ba]QRW12179.1 carbohydrate-binding domain protein [Ceratobasidium sp. AG-Ba]
MKFFTFAVAVLLPFLEVSQAAPTVTARDCAVIPSTANAAVRDQVYRITQSRAVTAKVLLSTFETAWIESHVNNLNCGDQDSIGVFQQRPSQGWGSYDQIMNVDYSTNKYLDQAIVNDRNNPGYTAGQLAQSVQRSEFPDRYDQAQSTAQDLINKARASVGGGTTNPGTGQCSGVAAYGSSTVYVGGQKCTYGGHLWTAKWWTQYETPSTGGSGVWQDNGSC